MGLIVLYSYPHSIPNILYTDRFYTLSSDMRHGYFEHFSDKELIKIGNEMLHGEELSEEQKSLYGIDD